MNMPYQQPEYLAALLQTPELFAPHVSQDGLRAAWIWMNRDAHTNVYVTDLQAQQSHRVTDDQRHYWLFGFANDAQHLVIGAHSGDECNDILILNPETLELRQAFSATPALEPMWASFDAKTQRVFCTAFDPETGGVKGLCRNLETLEIRELFSFPYAEHLIFHMSFDGYWLCFVARGHDENEVTIWLVNTFTAQSTALLVFPSNMLVRVNWHRDGRRLVIVADAPEGQHKRVGVYDVTTKQLIWLVDDPCRFVEFAFNPVNTDWICINEIDNGKSQCCLIHPDTLESIQVKADSGTVIPTGYNTNLEQWIVMHHAAQQPSDLIWAKFDKDGRVETHGSLTGFWQVVHYTAKQLYTPEMVTWVSSDNTPIQGFLYRNPHWNRGTVVLVHPGPHEVALDRFDLHVQYLVHSGFNVLEPNYRGSIGFGTHFRQAIYSDGWGGQEQVDIRFGMQYLLEQGIARHGRIAVMGYSYGGYSALCQVTFVSPDLVSAAISINGMSDLEADYASTHATIQSFIETAMGGSPEQLPHKYRMRSPVTYVPDLMGEVMLVQGMLDHNVNPINHQCMISALQNASKPFKELLFADEGHCVRRPDNLRHMMAQIEVFLSTSFYQAYNQLAREVY